MIAWSLHIEFGFLALAVSGLTHGHIAFVALTFHFKPQRIHANNAILFLIDLLPFSIHLLLGCREFVVVIVSIRVFPPSIGHEEPRIAFCLLLHYVDLESQVGHEYSSENVVRLPIEEVVRTALNVEGQEGMRCRQKVNEIVLWPKTRPPLVASVDLRQPDRTVEDQ